MQDARVVAKVWVQEAFLSDTASQIVTVWEEVPPRKPRRK